MLYCMGAERVEFPRGLEHCYIDMCIRLPIIENTKVVIVTVTKGVTTPGPRSKGASSPAPGLHTHEAMTVL